MLRPPVTEISFRRTSISMRLNVADNENDDASHGGDSNDALFITNDPFAENSMEYFPSSSASPASSESSSSSSLSSSLSSDHSFWDSEFHQAMDGDMPPSLPSRHHSRIFRFDCQCPDTSSPTQPRRKTILVQRFGDSNSNDLETKQPQQEQEQAQQPTQSLAATCLPRRKSQGDSCDMPPSIPQRDSQQPLHHSMLSTNFQPLLARSFPPSNDQGPIMPQKCASQVFLPSMDSSEASPCALETSGLVLDDDTSSTSSSCMNVGLDLML
mmetsp:Transcript_10370/g.28547  ORF Transcript_10370/g.28547 Transcript_10370/m.28547 type:complete len:269 (-) Transcript_10370:1262-2068(-)|eukprot:CAMPEP_0198130698 /NCGR_PEP_ID=MMETSP1442-20131203/54521_1 /TAXON_ID= /ORGANISM="Craspedostauros australis, Strain CCMP3328" /LENGTH=268 /DNA_ID=CAMNT_0043791373 /DNA_START=159 /DNA_END=965 /DNA_ORIENTATION=+